MAETVPVFAVENGVLVEQKEVDPHEVANNLLPITEAFADAIERQGKLSLTSLELSLSINAEGSVGFVTVGTEASVTVTFEPRKGS